MMIFLNFKKYVFFAYLGLLGLLAGCQYLPFIGNKIETGTQVVFTGENLSVENHLFSVRPEQFLIGELAAIQTQETDTLPDIARHFGLGHNEIVNANPLVDVWLPVPQTRVLLPLWFTLPDVPRTGIVLNLANMRLFYFPPKQTQQVMTYPAGIGREGWNTPMGLTKVISKTKNPTWTVPPSILREHAQKGDILPKTVPAGVDNPLGLYAMKLAKAGYLIHGTNKPYGVGMQVSHGCLNLYPEDIEALFGATAVGTAVRIIDQPYLVAWQNNMLYLEAHHPLDSKKDFKKPVLASLKKLEKKHKVQVDWTRVEQVINTANGVPTPVLIGSPSFAELNVYAPLLAHPEKLYGQPIVEPIQKTDWSITVARFGEERAAQKLAALLNHQGPSIPSRVEMQGDKFLIVAGPFHSKEEVLKILKRLEIELELKGEPNPPSLYMSVLHISRKT